MKLPGLEEELLFIRLEKNPDKKMLWLIEEEVIRI